MRQPSDQPIEPIEQKGPGKSPDAMKWGWRMVCAFIFAHAASSIAHDTPAGNRTIFVVLMVVLWGGFFWSLWKGKDRAATMLLSIFNVSFTMKTLPFAVPLELTQMLAISLMVAATYLYVRPRQSPSLAVKPAIAKVVIALLLVGTAVGPLIKSAATTSPKSVFDKYER